MDLFLIRHGDAVPLGDNGITEDEDRPLTEKGLNQSRALASGFQRLEISLGVVITSPLLRARQTAEEMLRHWGKPKPELLICDELSPGSKRRKLASYLLARDKDQIALVGHQPDLGELASWLMGSKKAQLELGKGGVAYLSCRNGPAKGTGNLIWLVTQKWLGTGSAPRSGS